MKGMVFNIQRFSLDDGPGIRTVVFLKGCPLRCLWCSNPESQNPRPELAHRDTICTKCGHCVKACPKNAIFIDDKGWHVSRTICDACGKCVDACVREALGIWGSEMTVEEVFKEVAKDIDFYENSCGGVTVSGGEPLFQPDFTAELLKRCRDEKIHTAVETSGYGSEDALKKVLPYTDLILYDLKCAYPELHKKLTGVSNEMIHSNLGFVAKKGVPVIIRFPVIPSFNDSEMEVNALANFVKMLGIKNVEVLPYHRFGVSKYKMLDREYKLEKLTPPTNDKLQMIKTLFESKGLRCKIVR